MASKTKALTRLQPSIEGSSVKSRYASMRKWKLAEQFARDFNLSDYETGRLIDAVWPHVCLASRDTKLWGDEKPDDYRSVYFPIEGIRVQWPEEFMSLVPYSRGRSSVIPLTYVTRFHLALMEKYIGQYAHALETLGELDEAKRAKVDASQRKVFGRIRRALDYLNDGYVTDEMVEMAWDHVVEAFGQMHEGNYPSEFPRWFAAWKRGQSPQS